MTSINRRHFSKLAATLGVNALLGASRSSVANESGGGSNSVSQQQKYEEMEMQHSQAMEKYASLMTGPRLTIGMVVYPGMFLLDLIGPLTVFEALMNRDIHLLWKNLDPVNNIKSENTSYIPILPTTAFKDCPKNLDVLFVPGGVPGTFDMMEDPEVISFLAEQGKTARYVTSVCTGSLILAAAGLLDGYRATSYWSMMDVLSKFGAKPVKGRVVEDRNRITGGGVTAGIDFALKIVGKLRSPEYAQAIQLYLEYDPMPPYNSGSPSKASKKVRDFILDMSAGMNKTADAIAAKIRRIYPQRFK